MAIVLNGTTGITAPDIDVTAQSTDITTTGDITAVDATLSGGLYLGGTGSANYLDDYEEGTWTPVDGSAANLTFTSNYGKYTKIGNQVICHFTLQYPTTSTTDVVYISGLPYANITLGSQGNNFGGGFGYTTINGNLGMYVYNQVIGLMLDGSYMQNFTASGKWVRGTITYQV